MTGFDPGKPPRYQLLHNHYLIGDRYIGYLCLPMPLAALYEFTIPDSNKSPKLN